MIAVFLLDFGGPASLKDVEPFLANLFSDRNIFPFPVAQGILAKIVAKFRTSKVAKQYELIGGASPSPKQTQDLASQLERTLQMANLDIRVFVGFRYSEPSIWEVLKQLAQEKPNGVIVIPMFPHYSSATTLSVLMEFQKAYDQQNLNIPYQIVEWWYDQLHYIAAWCYSIKKTLDFFEEGLRHKVPILFSAHGLPASFVTERKDPYPKQIKECAEKIVTYLGGDHPAYISYQSKVGPVEWLKPSTMEFVKELGSRGMKQLVIAPISFLTDHIETLYEIDHEIIPAARNAGMEQVMRCEALCHGPYLQKCLEDLVLRRLPSLLK